MIEISPKMYAKSYPSFLVRRMGTAKGISLFAVMGYLLFGVMVVFFTITNRRMELAKAPVLEQFIFATVVTAIFFLFFLAIFTLISYFTVWKRKWIYANNEVLTIVGHSRRSLSYRNLTKITMESPFCAKLEFREPGGRLLDWFFWYGQTKEDWLSFVEFLKTNVSNVEEIIFIPQSRGMTSEEKQLPPNEAFEEIMKLFPNP